MAEFDRENFKKILKDNKLTQKDLVDKLVHHYMIETEIDAVKSWTRTTKANKPSMERLLAIADMCNCSIQDFFSDANLRRSQITNEEISKNPNQYLHLGIPTIQVNHDYIELPTIHAGAGNAFAVETAERVSYPRELIPSEIALDENVLVIVVAGNSMEPLYYENDTVFIDMVNGRNFLPINGTYLVRYGDSVQIKDVEFLGNDDILLSSRNSKAMIQPKRDLGLDWEIVGKPYANLHPVVGSKLKIVD